MKELGKFFGILRIFFQKSYIGYNKLKCLVKNRNCGNYPLFGPESALPKYDGDRADMFMDFETFQQLTSSIEMMSNNCVVYSIFEFIL